VSDLIALGRSKPGGLNYATIGLGSSIHLQGERFRARVGIEAQPAHYKESYIPDLITGRVSYVVHITAAVGPHIKAGKLKGLAVLSTERVTSLPEVPTSAEAGLPDLIYNAGVCLYAPGGTPKDVVTRVNGALAKALTADNVRQRFADLGVGSPEQAAEYIVELLADQDKLRTRVFGKAR
jgi:tripartite-type tricarboxylate transporter receptor subunit TctC